MAAEDAVRLGGPAPAVGRPGPAGAAPAGAARRRRRSSCPWNWPYTMAAELFAPALAAGNTVVWLAAPTTAACSAAARLGADRDRRSGLPPGVLELPQRPRRGGRRRAGRPSGRRCGRLHRLGGDRPVGGRRAAGKTQILELGGNGPLSCWTTPTSTRRSPPSSRRPTSAPGRAAPPASGSSCTAPSGGELVERLEAAVRSSGCASATPSTRPPRWAR